MSNYLTTVSKVNNTDMTVTELLMARHELVAVMHNEPLARNYAASVINKIDQKISDKAKVAYLISR